VPSFRPSKYLLSDGYCSRDPNNVTCIIAIPLMTFLFCCCCCCCWFCIICGGPNNKSDFGSFRYV
jgi:hypothetical protein